MKTLVIGLGNPLLGDDGVGWVIAERINQEIRVRNASFQEFIEVDCLAIGGLSLMERLIGYTNAILIDAVTTGKSPLGNVSSCPLEALPNRAFGHLCSAHDTTLQNAIQVGQKMGAQLPSQIIIVGVETYQVFEFSENLSPEVADSIPRAVALVLNLLQIEAKNSCIPRKQGALNLCPTSSSQ